MEQEPEKLKKVSEIFDNFNINRVCACVCVIIRYVYTTVCIRPSAAVEVIDIL